MAYIKNVVVENPALDPAKVILYDDSGSFISDINTLPVGGSADTNPQHPLATDSDTVYVKDLNLSYCDNGDFSGSVSDYFDSMKTVNTNTTGDNPKVLKIWFERTVYAHEIGLGCDDIAKGFGTDVTVKLLGSGEAVRFTQNFTGLDPNSALLEFGPKAFNGFILEFNTTNEVCLSNITIRKAIETTATLQALKPDGDVTNIDATAGGNLKVSVEELESGISTNANSQLKTTLYDSDGVELGIDPSTGAICQESYAHCEIHKGDHYYIKNWVDLSNGEVVDFLVVTPDTAKWAHMLVSFSFEAEATAIIYEDTTTSANGTPVSVLNRNRNSSNTNGVLVYSAPTVTSPGTQLSAYKAGAGKLVGGEARATQEIVLKQNTKYLIRVTNDTTSNNWFDYLADWYEHSNIQ